MLNLSFRHLFILDENYRPKPDLVDTFTSNLTDNTITFKLKDGLKWQDGRAVTADDVLYSIDILNRAGEKVIYKKMINDIASYKKIDELTVVVQYKKPKMLIGFDLLFPIIPKHHYNQSGVDNSFNPLGNGYYIYKHNNKSRKYEFVRDETIKKIGDFDRIEAHILHSRDPYLYGFMQDKIDIILTNFEEWTEYNLGEDFNTYYTYNQSLEFLGYNLDRILLQDDYLRQLIENTIDKNEILKKIYLNNGGIAETPVNPDSFLFVSERNKNKRKLTKEEENRIIESYFIQEEVDGKLYMYKNINNIKRELVLNLVVNEKNELRLKTANYIKERLGYIGIKININKLPFNEYMEKIEMGNYDLFLGGYNFDVDQNIISLIGYYKDSEFANVFNYKGNDIEGRIKAIENARGEEQYKNALQALQNLLNENRILTSIIYKKDLILTRKNIYLEGYVPYSNKFSIIKDLILK